MAAPITKVEAGPEEKQSNKQPYITRIIVTAVRTSVQQQTETREPSRWRPAATSGAGGRQ